MKIILGLCRDNEPVLLNWFIDKFHDYCNLNDKIYIKIEDLDFILEDLEASCFILMIFMKF